MYGIFVNENGCIHYAQLIVDGIKTAETRNKDMLKDLVGKRVAIVRTRRGKQATIVGYVTIDSKQFCKAEEFHQFDSAHFVPDGSSYDVHGKGKWLYWLKDAEKCVPFPLPSDAVRHGMSWCEFSYDKDAIDKNRDGIWVTENGFIHRYYHEKYGFCEYQIPFYEVVYLGNEVDAEGDIGKFFDQFCDYEFCVNGKAKCSDFNDHVAVNNYLSEYDFKFERTEDVLNILVAIARDANDIRWHEFRDSISMLESLGLNTEWHIDDSANYDVYVNGMLMVSDNYHENVDALADMVCGIEFYVKHIKDN